MLVLPLPLFVALVLGFLFLQSRFVKPLPGLFSALLAVCALQNLIVALGQYYGFSLAIGVQPVLATCIPPLAWLAFLSASFRPVSLRQDALHCASPAFTLFCLVFAPVALDGVIVLIFIGYGAAMLGSVLKNQNALPLARLDAGAVPQRIWTAIAISLILSGLSDIAIAFALESGSPGLAAQIISAGAAAALLAIGVMSLSPNIAPVLSTERDNDTQKPETASDKTGPSEEDAVLIGQLERLLADNKLYLDPGLTLSRLAHRLKVPAKQVSAAINRQTGENISRYINRHRIAHACTLLETGNSATAAMLDSGFNTKSNFNREFLRVTGKTPSTWKVEDRQT